MLKMNVLLMIDIFSWSLKGDIWTFFWLYSLFITFWAVLWVNFWSDIHHRRTIFRDFFFSASIVCALDAVNELFDDIHVRPHV